MSAVPLGQCRACRASWTPDSLVLDLGEVPAADHFPLPDEPGPDPRHPLSAWACPQCGLLQLTEDPTGADEPRAVEPEALRRQAAASVAQVLGWLDPAAPGSVSEFGSPHGGSWLGLFADRGWEVRDTAAARADVVVDPFGLMHAPDLRAAVGERAAALAPNGVLLVLVHSAEAILRHGQWSSLRHGHYGYFCLTSLVPLLAGAGLVPVRCWEDETYGGCLLTAFTPAGRPDGVPNRHPSVQAVLDREAAAGAAEPHRLRRLQQAADGESAALAEALGSGAGGWYAYGAASRAVAVLARAGASPRTLLAVADASPAKQGRCLPGSRVPIISPEALVAADPERIWLLLPDLRDEVEAAWPTLAGRWATPGTT